MKLACCYIVFIGITKPLVLISKVLEDWVKVICLKKLKERL